MNASLHRPAKRIALAAASVALLFGAAACGDVEPPAQDITQMAPGAPAPNYPYAPDAVKPSPDTPDYPYAPGGVALKDLDRTTGKSDHIRQLRKHPDTRP